MRTLTKVTVLEPDGRHWFLELTKPQLGLPIIRAVPHPIDPTKDDLPVDAPCYTRIDYYGTAIQDGLGNRHWVYWRTR